MQSQVTIEATPATIPSALVAPAVLPPVGLSEETGGKTAGATRARTNGETETLFTPK